jgi:hypothetical protein
MAASVRGCFFVQSAIFHPVFFGRCAQNSGICVHLCQAFLFAGKIFILFVRQQLIGLRGCFLQLFIEMQQ